MGLGGGKVHLSLCDERPASCLRGSPSEKHSAAALPQPGGPMVSAAARRSCPLHCVAHTPAILEHLCYTKMPTEPISPALPLLEETAARNSFLFTPSRVTSTFAARQRSLNSMSGFAAFKFDPERLKSLVCRTCWLFKYNGEKLPIGVGSKEQFSCLSDGGSAGL